ncbi:MAG: hypothetical protein AB7T22_05585 [Calditrichaceae bacterium]
MRKVLFNLSAILLLIFAIEPNPAAASESDSLQSFVELRTFMDQEQVALNREVVYVVDMSWSGELSRYKIIDAGDPAAANLKLRGSGSSNRFFTDDKGNPHSVKRITYYFTPVELGMAYVDGVTIRYEDTLTGQQETLSARRLEAKIINPIPDKNNGPILEMVIVWMFILAFSFAVVFYVLKYFRKRKLNQRIPEAEPVSIEQKYLQILKETISSSGKPPTESLNLLTKIFNSYVSEKYKLTGGFSSEFINEKFKSENLNPEIINKLKQLYDRAELTKFAGEDISANEFHLFYDTVEMALSRFENISGLSNVK